jgi:hypothetical protein
VIFKGSRYEKVGAIQVTDASGRVVSALRLRIIPPTPAGFVHTMRDGERLDLLAAKYYGNPEKSWLIADANPEIDPDDLLEPGRSILIPPDRTN